MQATSTLERSELPPQTPASRSWTRAVQDIRTGVNQRELWAHLGWQDIKQRYRRSVIGPLWITISMGVTSVGLGVLYSVLFNVPSIGTYLPYVVVGFIVWNFINGCLLEGMDTFIANEGMIKQMPAPLSVYVLRTVWRQVLMLLHNLAIYVVVLVIFFRYLDRPYTMVAGGSPHPGLSLYALVAIPGFALIAINGVWVALLFGIISTRFRDIPQVINSLIQLAFYMTPIVWNPDTFLSQPGKQWAHFVFQLNPLYHFVQVVRAPLIGQVVSPVTWAVVGGITIIGWALALLAMRNYRARVSYWV